jgi:hypothetical protein
VTGSILSGAGGGFAVVLANTEFSIIGQIGLFFGLFSLGWLMIVLFSKLKSGKTAWWALILAAQSVGIGILFSGFVDSLMSGVGTELTLLALVFIAWGISEKKIGLVIAGGNLLGLGFSILIAWSNLLAESVLSKIGVLLIGLSLGWVLIIIFSYVSSNATVWYALIPAGIMGIVGWGLFFGGHPGFSAEVIGNIGSIVLIAIGLYLLLLRSGMRK